MAGINGNVGTFNDLTKDQKVTLETYASGANMLVEHSPDGTSTITFPNNTYLGAFMLLCTGFNQKVTMIKGTKTVRG
jgi:hypothetical protein